MAKPSQPLAPRGAIDIKKLRVLQSVAELDGLPEDTLKAFSKIFDLWVYPRTKLGPVVGAVRRLVTTVGGFESDNPYGNRPRKHYDGEDPRWIHGPNQGSESISLCIVVEGRVRLIEPGQDATRSLGAGTLFGEQGHFARTGEPYMRIDAEPLGRAWIMEAQPEDVDRLLATHPEIRARIRRGFEAAKVALPVVDALKASPDLRAVRLDHLYALSEGAEIRTLLKDKTLPELRDGELSTGLCVPLEGRVVHRPTRLEPGHEPSGMTAVGLSELVRGQRVNGSYVAQTALRYLFIPAERFEAQLAMVPEFLRAVREAVGFDPLHSRGGGSNLRRPGAQVVLLVAQRSLKLNIAPIADLLGEAVATHLYDRTCVLHLVPDTQTPPPAQTVLAKNQDPRYPDTARILHRWMCVPTTAPDAWAARVDEVVGELLAEREFGEFAYDVVVVDGSCLPPVDDEAGAHQMTAMTTLSKIAYLHTNPEDPLPVSLLVGRIEVVPVGILGAKRHMYPLGEIMIELGREDAKDGIVSSIARVPKALAKYTRSRRDRVNEILSETRRKIDEMNSPQDFSDLTIGTMPSWSPRTVRVRVAPKHREALKYTPGVLHTEPARLDAFDGLLDSMNRLARGVTGRRVGVALGGGGAFGYVHASLLNKLTHEDYNVPVDLLSGSSFGTVVGTYYAAGDTTFERLKAHHYFMTGAVSIGVLSTVGMTKAIDLDLGRLDLNELDVALFPTVTNADTGHEGTVRRGTIGYGVRASGSLPPFAPTIHGQDRLLDGGLAANVPVQVLADEGAGLIISSNPIPDPEPRDPKAPLPIPGLGTFLRMSDPRDRLMDGIRSSLILMRAASSSQERFADVRYLAQTRGTTMFQFGDVDKIMEGTDLDREGKLHSAVEQAVEQWRAKLNHPPARIRLEKKYINVPPGLRFMDVGGSVVLTDLGDKILLEVATFLVDRPDLGRIEIQVAKAAVALQGEGTLDRAEEAAEYIRDTLERCQVAGARLSIKAVEAPARPGRNVDFQVSRLLGRVRDPQLDVRRDKLVKEAKEALDRGESRLARLLALEAARPEMTVDGAPRADVEAILRDILDVPVRLLHVFEGEEPYTTAAFSPDGRWVALGGGGKTVVCIFDLWDPERHLFLETDTDGPVMMMQWSPDGSKLAVTGHMSDRRIVVWDTSALAEVRLEVQRIAQPDVGNWWVWGVDWSPDGTRLLGSYLRGGDYLAMWTDLAAEPIKMKHDAQVLRAAFNHDGTLIASASRDGRVGLWNGETGAHVAWLVDGDRQTSEVVWQPGTNTLAAIVGRDVHVWRDPRDEATPPEVLSGHLRNVTHLAWSPDGSILASGSRDKTARLWEGTPLGLHMVLGGHPGRVHDVRFGPEGEMVATAASNRAFVWSTVSGDRFAKIAPAKDMVTGMRWHPDDSILLTCAGGQVSLRDPGSRRSMLLELATNDVIDAGWDPEHDARGYVTSAEGVVAVWDPANGDPTGLQWGDEEAGVPARASWSPDGVWLAMSTREDDDTRLRVAEVDGDRQWQVDLPDDEVDRIRWSPTGERLFTGQGSTIRVYTFDPAHGLALEHGPIDYGMVAYAWSPDGSQLAITSWTADTPVKIWSLDKPFEDKIDLMSPGDAVWDLAWSSDGAYLASAHNDGNIYWWRTADWAHGDVNGHRMPPGSPTHARAITFEAGSHRLAAGVGRFVHLFDLDVEGDHGKQVLEGHTATVTRLAWSADGRYLVSGCESGGVHLWYPFTTRGSVELRGYDDAVHGLAFSPSGHRIMSWSADAKVRVHLAAPEDVLQETGEASGMNEMTREEWERFMQGAGPRRPSWPFDAKPSGDGPRPKYLRKG